MEACAGAAKVVKGRNAAALEAKGHGSAAGPQARLRRAAVMVRRAGIPRIAIKVLDGICVVRSGAVCLVEVPTIVAANKGIAGGRILGLFERRQPLQRPKRYSGKLLQTRLRSICEQE